MEKRPHKMKLLDDIAETLRKEWKEVNHNNVSIHIMGVIRRGDYLAGSYGKITQSDIGRYFREFYVEVD